MKRCPPYLCRHFRPFRGRFNAIQIDLFRLTFIKCAEVRCYWNRSISPQRPNAQGKASPQQGPFGRGRPARHYRDAALTGLFFLAAFVTAGSYLSAGPQAMSTVSKVTPLPRTEGGEAASRVASIVIETDKKGRCEERRFDNRTGKMVSANYVNCDARLEPEARHHAVGKYQPRAGPRHPRCIQEIVDHEFSGPAPIVAASC